MFNPDDEKARYDARAAEGLCTRCGGKPREGRKLCDVCAAKQAERAKAFRERRKKLGSCHECGAKVTPPHVRCDSCRERARAKAAA